MVLGPSGYRIRTDRFLKEIVFRVGQTPPVERCLVAVAVVEDRLVTAVCAEFHLVNPVEVVT